MVWRNLVSFLHVCEITLQLLNIKKNYVYGCASCNLKFLAKFVCIKRLQQIVKNHSSVFCLFCRFNFLVFPIGNRSLWKNDGDWRLTFLCQGELSKPLLFFFLNIEVSIKTIIFMNFFNLIHIKKSVLYYNINIKLWKFNNACPDALDGF